MERKQSAKAVKSFESGGERGIRTLDTGFSPYNGLANRRLQPLGHLSSITYGLAIVLSCLLYTIGTSRIRGMAGRLLAAPSLFPLVPDIFLRENVAETQKEQPVPALAQNARTGAPHPELIQR